MPFRSALRVRLRQTRSRLTNALLGLGRAPDRTLVDEEERLRSYPEPYPSGWYVLARSDEVTTTPRHVRALGRSLVVYRGESGRAVVLDATCPHQGASLVGGRVVGDCIQCPFHEWELDPEGQVVAIPYNDRLTATLRTNAYHVDERYGFVRFFHDQDSSERRGVGHPPPYLPARFTPIEDGTQRHLGDLDAGIVRMHLIEFAENSVDFQHFSPLHGEMFLPWTGIKLPGLEVRHAARWELDPEQPHQAWFLNDAKLYALGREVPRGGASARILIDGPGGLVSFHFDIPDLGHITILQTHTPVGPLAQEVRFRWFADRAVPRPIASYVVGNWLSQWREDVRVWESKRYRRRPMLVKGDGPVHPMRRWYMRFYEAPGGGPLVPLTRKTAEG